MEECCAKEGQGWCMWELVPHKAEVGDSSWEGSSYAVQGETEMGEAGMDGGKELWEMAQVLGV